MAYRANTKSEPTPRATSSDEALHLLNEALAYYTPQPRLVTDRSSQPSPVIEEYYAA